MLHIPSTKCNPQTRDEVVGAHGLDWSSGVDRFIASTHACLRASGNAGMR